MSLVNKRKRPDIKNLLGLLMIYFFNCFPIKINKIFLFSYYGSQYGCSPKYITEYILKNCPEGQLDLVWAFNDVESKEHLAGIRRVKIMSLRYFYELCTSKIIITNFRTTDLFVKRRKQYYIQTWHSSLRLKQIEKDAEEALPPNYVEMAKRDSLKCDLLLSGCRFSTDIFKRAFWYEGAIFEHGTPRNDVLFQKNSTLREKIISSLNIPKEHNIVLYAPTFRKGDSLEVYNLDYAAVLTALKEKFGGEWTFLVKLHPHLLSRSKELLNHNDVIDATSYDDVQELLCVSDFLITDYSSLMFDFAITRRLCYLYVPDFYEYIQNDRNLYFDLKELPFINAKSNEELVSKIKGFNNENYQQNLDDFLSKVGSFEDGRASENLVNHIQKVCFR